MIWAGDHAIPAAYAFIAIYSNYPILSLLGSAGGANRYAWCLFTMIAKHWKDLISDLRKFTLLGR